MEELVREGAVGAPKFSTAYDSLPGNRFTAYAVTNLRKARKFYEGVLGLKAARELSDHFVEYDIGPGTLAVGCSKQWPPSKTGTSAALEVVDFAAAVAHLRKKKVRLALGPMDNPRCSMVGVRDPDGNLIVLHHRHKPAMGRK